MGDDVLRLGSTGELVTQLQTMLQQLGYGVGTVDGSFGPRTEATVSAYREWRGLGDGGDADESVLSTLEADVQSHWGWTDATEDARADGYDPYAAGTEAAGDSTEGIRQAAIAAAYGEIDLVRAKEAGEVDETGQSTRYGWERLTEYFDVAAPGIWSEDVVKHLKPGLPSWCGIFTLWALKTGGASVGTWGMGTGIPGIKPVTDPQPGDIGYMNENQHYCLVVTVDGDQVHSIDGNTVGDDTGAARSTTARGPRATSLDSSRSSEVLPTSHPPDKAVECRRPDALGNRRTARLDCTSSGAHNADRPSPRYGGAGHGLTDGHVAGSDHPLD